MTSMSRVQNTRSGSTKSDRKFERLNKNKKFHEKNRAHFRFLFTKLQFINLAPAELLLRFCILFELFKILIRA
jgi:hypothetical protein